MSCYRCITVLYSIKLNSILQALYSLFSLTHLVPVFDWMIWYIMKFVGMWFIFCTGCRHLMKHCSCLQLGLQLVRQPTHWLPGRPWQHPWFLEVGQPGSRRASVVQTSSDIRAQRIIVCQRASVKRKGERCQSLGKVKSLTGHTTETADNGRASRAVRATSRRTRLRQWTETVSCRKGEDNNSVSLTANDIW